MTGHTKEPWAYRPDAHDDWGIIRAPVTEQGQWLGGIICQARDPERLGESELAACRVAKTDPWGANARRIVDCVNALAGIPDPAAFVAAAMGMREAWTKCLDGVELRRGEVVLHATAWLALCDAACTFRTAIVETDND